MKTNFIASQLNMDCFFRFSRMKMEEQANVLRQNGILIDEEKQKDLITRLYFVNGFFAEETVTVLNNTTLEIIPFRRGYKLDSYLEVKEVLIPKLTL